VRGCVAKDLLDLRPNTFRICNNLIRPKSDDAPTFKFHRCRATRIGLDLKRMMIAVDLDHQLPRYAGEVCKVGADGILSSEFRAAYAAIPQQFPDLTFGPAAVLTEVACLVGIVVFSGHNPLT